MQALDAIRDTGKSLFYISGFGLNFKFTEIVCSCEWCLVGQEFGCMSFMLALTAGPSGVFLFKKRY